MGEVAGSTAAMFGNHRHEPGLTPTPFIRRIRRSSSDWRAAIRMEGPAARMKIAVLPNSLVLEQAHAGILRQQTILD
jgi:hypothetical protein